MLELRGLTTGFLFATLLLDSSSASACFNDVSQLQNNPAKPVREPHAPEAEPSVEEASGQSDEQLPRYREVKFSDKVEIWPICKESDQEYEDDQDAADEAWERSHFFNSLSRKLGLLNQLELRYFSECKLKWIKRRIKRLRYRLKLLKRQMRFDPPDSNDWNKVNYFCNEIELVLGKIAEARGRVRQHSLVGVPEAWMETEEEVDQP